MRSLIFFFKIDEVMAAILNVFNPALSWFAIKISQIGWLLLPIWPIMFLNRIQNGRQNKKNKIAQGNVNIFSHLTFFILTFYFVISAILFGNDASNWLNISKLVISMSILVEIDTPLALFQKNIFGGPFDFFFSNYIGRIYKPILLIFFSKQQNKIFYLISNLKENKSKITTLRVPQRYTYKMAAMTSSILTFQNPRKPDLANI